MRKFFAHRVLVCGGREYSDWNNLVYHMDSLKDEFEISVIIHGDARGADTLAANWAKHNSIPDLPFPADWDKYNRAAGPIRNKRMLDEGKPDIVIAFPGDTGTQNMIHQAQKRDTEVRVIP